MKARYAELFVRISITITVREHIFPWGRTRRSHERFSRRKWGPSWRCRMSADCTTATNGGLPERAIYNLTWLRTARSCRLKLLVGTVLANRCASADLFHQIEAGSANRLRFLWRNNFRHGLHRIFGRPTLEWRHPPVSHPPVRLHGVF